MNEMGELAQYRPTERFAGLADNYAKFRPSYPAAAIDYIIARCGLSGSSLLVDVGCGTGISSRLFAARGVRVLGLEPNAEMRTKAEAEPLPAEWPKPIYQDGRAEATGLPSNTAEAILAAQAFHWFAADVALREFHRILKPGGWVILLWNERAESDPFTAAYGAVIRQAPDASAVEIPRGRAGEVLLTCAWFENQERVCFPNEQKLDEEGLLGRSFSASYAPREPDQAAAWGKALRAVFARYQHGGKVVLRYETSVYLGQRQTALSSR